MSRRPAPTRGGAGRHRPATPDLPGLVVDCGRYTAFEPGSGVWSRAPAAVWRCRHGCIRHASGAPAVAELLATLTDAPHQLHDPVRHPTLTGRR